jgi:triosephosphate isomerase (TIM)
MAREGKVMARTKIVIGNWKMNLSVPESTVQLSKLKQEVNPKHTEVVVCPGFLDIYSATEVLAGTEIGVGAQDAYFEDAGAYTGEVSAHQLKGFVEYAIVGHSERRHIFGETDKITAKKAAACVRHQITPIICVGESLHEKLDGLANMVVAAQVEASLADLTAKEVAKSVVAYEPVWAIGTGHVCDAKKAEDAAKKIRNLIKVLFGAEAAQNVRIVYGGSVTEKNAASFVAQPNIDGCLVGGASLDHQVFAKIITSIDGQSGGMSKSKNPISNQAQSPKSKTKPKKKV